MNHALPIRETHRCVPGPLGGEVMVPVTPADNETATFAADDLVAARAYYDAEGYVVIRGAVAVADCVAAHQAYLQEVKPDRGFFYRQTSSGRYERHVFTPQGFMLNAMLNVQDFDRRRSPLFPDAALKVLTAPALQSAAAALLGEKAKIVQTMYFEGNPATWAHQDSYYLDSEKIGTMVAAWVALEEIAPGAGRFYVYPRSHKVDMLRHAAGVDIAFNHDRYKAAMLQAVAEQGLPCHAPALGPGDVLFWNALTVHGSLATTQPERSRNSFTMHLLAESHGFLQFQSRLRQLNLETVNGISVHHPKNLNRFRNRAVAFAETYFPGPFYALKNLAIRALVSRK